MRQLFVSFILLVSATMLLNPSNLNAQMTINGADLYGNEWIDYSKEYARIDVEEDGFYRISYNELVSAGFPIAGKQGSELELYHLGQPVAILVSTNGQFSSSDYIEFYGEKNDGWMDQFLFENPDDRLNTAYSMYTDNSRYFLTYGESDVTRYTDATSTLTNLPDREEFYMHTEDLIFTEKHSSPPANQSFTLKFSHYRPAEGFGTRLDTEFEYDISASAKYTGDAPLPFVTVRQGIYFDQRQTLVTVNGQDKMTHVTPQLSVDEYTVDLDIDDIINNINIKLVSSGLLSTHSSTSILSKVGVTYPRRFIATDSESFVFNITGSDFIRYYEIEDFNHTSNTKVIDLNNGYVVTPQAFGTGVRFELPAGQESRIVITNNANSPTDVSSKSYEDYSTLSGDLLMITSESLNNGSNSAARQYSDYRRSEKGGGHDVIVINSEDLIDQYAYGVKGHTLGINNFIRSEEGDIDGLRYIFLFGKGLSYDSYRADPAFHLPTWGVPGSDNLMLSQNGRIAPDVAIGRVAVRTPESALQYLDKVVDYEDISEYDQTVEDLSWMKKVIHLSGGTDDGEVAAIFSNLNRYRDTLVNSQFGANVNTYQKTSQDNVQTTLSEQITNDMNAGAFMITFFGHSSSGNFDFSIEEPSALENKGKLPIINSMGCNSGDIFNNSFSLSERYVLEPEVGSIAFLASSGSAALNSLSIFGNEFYTNLGGQFYQARLGENLNTVVNSIENLGGSDQNFVTLTEQFSLHGDPALNILSFDGPDYTLTIDNVTTEPEQLSSNLDSIDFSFDVFNLGNWEEETLNYMIIHDYEEQIDTFFGSTITPKFSKTITKRIPINGSKVIGRNEFNIVLDQNELIAEIPNPTAEENNSLTAIFGEGFVKLAFDGSARPIYPAEYAMVVDQGITLKASADNAFVDIANYTIQIDTSELFDSPLLEQTTIESSGGLVQWTPPVTYQDNTVYYWRIKNDNLSTQEWRSSSFGYYPDKGVGWNQSHFYQFQDLDYRGIVLEENRLMDFASVPVEHKVVNLKRVFPDFTPTYTINSTFKDSNPGEDAFAYWDVSSGMFAIVVDPVTSKEWKLPSEGSPLAPCAVTPPNIRDRSVFPHPLNTSTQRECFLEFIEGSVPDGHYVIVFTIQSNVHSYKPEEWEGDEAIYGRSIFSVLENQGAERVRELATNEVPYIFAYQKGVGPVDEVLAPSSDDAITLFANIDGIGNDGNITSTVVGPALSWETLEWGTDVLNDNDNVSVSIYGIASDGEKTLLVDSLNTTTADLSNIDAQAYPNLELVYNVSDSVDLTAADLDHWRIYFRPLPEAAINTEEAFAFNNEFLSKGEELSLTYTVENISDEDMSDMLVRYTIVNTRNNETLSWEERNGTLPAQSQVVYDIQFDTSDLGTGKYELQISVNPEFDQPEQFLFNNVGVINFEILGNDLNPLLDVTFDGIRINDGDIVSPTPDIAISLSDDNLFSLLESRDLFQITLEYPDFSIVPIDVNSPEIEFFPATEEGISNEALMIFTPTLEAGTYKLSVQAEDNTGNLSGAYGYNVVFEVVESKRIVSFTNYPNPFSNSINFVFSATGDDLPSDYELAIFNELGNRVRTITSDDIGQLPTGLNRVYFTWDGTDGTGSTLPNGVYFYRLFFEDVEGFVTDDKFSKGNGKIIMMR